MRQRASEMFVPQTSGRGRVLRAAVSDPTPVPMIQSEVGASRRCPSADARLDPPVWNGELPPAAEVVRPVNASREQRGHAVHPLSASWQLVPGDCPATFRRVAPIVTDDGDAGCGVPATRRAWRVPQTTQSSNFEENRAFWNTAPERYPRSEEDQGGRGAPTRRPHGGCCGCGMIDGDRREEGLPPFPQHRGDEGQFRKVFRDERADGTPAAQAVWYPVTRDGPAPRDERNDAARDPRDLPPSGDHNGQQMHPMHCAQSLPRELHGARPAQEIWTSSWYSRLSRTVSR